MGRSFQGGTKVAQQSFMNDVNGSANSAPVLRVRQQRGETVVELSGCWRLLVDAAGRRRVEAELRKLSATDATRWDLGKVEGLDSAGAAVLWRSWGQRLPAALECSSNYREQLGRFQAIERTPRPRARGFIPVLALGGRAMEARLRTVGDVAVLVGQVLMSVLYALRFPRFAPVKEISATVYKAGCSSVPLIGILGLLLGAVTTYQIGDQLADFSASTSIAGIMGTGMMRELGAVVTSLILAGRTGSALTAEIGAMHLSGELEALRTFGVSPVLRLAVPRTVGLALSLPLLVVWAEFTGLLGAMIIADTTLGITPQYFLSRLPRDVQLVNFWIGLVKAAVFGITIGVVASYYGLKAEPSTEGVSRSTTNSVVVSLSLVLLLDAASGVLLSDVGI